MDREVLLLVLVFVLTGIALPVCSFVGGLMPTLHESCSGRQLERAAFRRLLFPVICLAPVLSSLLGWAIVEPRIAEPAPVAALVVACVVSIIVVRGLVRSVRALERPKILTAATLGIWRPRIVVAPEFAALVDEAALKAALAHEQMHVNHRDPLRIWLAQLVSDLQWPMPGSARRLRQWLFCLELARDEEAREHADGADLAMAVLAAHKREQLFRFGVAGIASPGTAIRLRIERLLAPQIRPVEQSHRSFLNPVVAVAILAASMFMGSRLGESFVRTLFGWC